MAAVSQQNGGLHLCSGGGSNNSGEDFSSTEGSPAPAAVELRSSSSSPSSATAPPVMGLLEQRHRRSSNAPASTTTTGTASLVGASCGQHGPYTFYKAAKVAVHHRSSTRILALGDFFLVKLWTDQEIIAIGELQLLWTDCYQSPDSPLASLKLYFLPENTPDGRHEEHGEDEVVSISEKVVLKVSDLATWIVEDVKWERGATAVWERHCATPPLTPPPFVPPSDTTFPPSAVETSTEQLPTESPTNYGVLDMRDVIKEKSIQSDNVGGWNVLVLSYPAYCRYRSTLKRLEGHCQTDFMRRAVVEAIGGRAAPCPNTRVVFCKDTFDYPELEDHELLCNHLAPKWKGRPRKMRKKRSHSPGSESNESESSVSTVTSSSRSKDSPMKQPRGGIRNVPAPYRPGDRPKGEQLFLQKLHKFMAGRGTPIGRLPSLGFKQLDLFLFYNKVQRAGGYESAVANKQWKGIYIELGGHPSNTSAATCTRRHYEKLLLPFERQSASEPIMTTTPSSADSLPSTTSSGTPPKKRKMSDHQIIKEEPAEVKEEVKEECRIVESQLRPSESTPDGAVVEEKPPKSPRIVESSLPLLSSGGSVIVWSASAPSIEAGPPPPKSPDPVEDVQQRTLTLPDLVADPALLAAMAASAGADPKALNDLARLAQQHMDKAAAGLTRIKESKINPQQHSDERSGQNNLRRPSIIIQKGDSAKLIKSSGSSSGGGAISQTGGAPPPAHSQKPVTLPASASGSGQTNEYYSQSQTTDDSIPAAGGRQQLPQVPPAAMLELALCPPTPAVVTPSIFVPSRRIYVDPSLDVKKSRSNPASVGSSIPAAHCNRGLNPVTSNPHHPSNSSPSKPAAAPVPVERAPQLIQVTPPRPPPPQPPPIPAAVRQHTAPPHHHHHHQQQQRPSIPLVDLTSRPKAEEPASSAAARTPTGLKSVELNGKSSHQLMDLSVNHFPPSFRPLEQQQHKLPKWNHPPPQQQHHSSSRNSDVSISLNVKIEGSNTDERHHHQQQQQQQQHHHHHQKASSSSSSGHHHSSQQQQLPHRHSVSVVPVVKDESRHHRREKEILRPSSSIPIPAPQTNNPTIQSYPRMVDSLAMSKAASSGSAPPPPSMNYNYATASSGSSSSSSKPPTSMYPGLMDPALASYYSSIYSPHMYGLPPPGAFAHHPGGSHPGMFHHPHPSSAAAEVTAQVYKDLVQRGYPPALAPGLPPGLAGIPGLSSYMFSSMGGGGAPGAGKDSNNPSSSSDRSHK